MASLDHSSSVWPWHTRSCPWWRLVVGVAGNVGLARARDSNPWYRPVPGDGDRIDAVDSSATFVRNVACVPPAWLSRRGAGLHSPAGRTGAGRPAVVADRLEPALHLYLCGGPPLSRGPAAAPAVAPPAARRTSSS